MKKIVVIGGGAAGFFAAINIAEKLPEAEITILERTDKLLSKVKISGGGRCNVTNVISDPAELAKYYPRGNRFLKKAFYNFSSNDVINWFEKRNVKLKVEHDGRVFPATDNSQTIIDCFLNSAEKVNIKIQKNVKINKIAPPIDQSSVWKIITSDGILEADKFIIASGSNQQMWNLLENIGHNIISPVPSLFTFNIKDERLKELAGISVKNVKVLIDNSSLSCEGDLLITHWGLSGPAILKLSAWGARDLFEKNYNFKIILNWINLNPEQTKEQLLNFKKVYTNKNVASNPQFNLPLRLWERIIISAGSSKDLKWNDLSKKLIQKMADELSSAKFEVTGKSTFKDEFVTCGGIDLNEVDVKTMQSKIHKGLFFAGEVLDVDAVTGGFNFQSAWTTAWIAANSIINN